MHTASGLVMDVGGDLEAALDAIEARPQLGFTPEPPNREQLRTIIEAAW